MPLSWLLFGMEEQKKPAQRHYAPKAECKIKRFQLHVYFQHQAHARYVFGERFKRPRLPQNRISLLLVGLLGGLGSLSSNLLGGGGLDDTDSNGLPHVPDGKPSKGRELSEGLDAHGLAGEQLDNGSVTGLDELGSILSGLSSTPVNLLQDLGELAGNVRGVAIKHRRVAVGHLSGMVEHDDLGSEVRNTSSGLVLGVGGDIATLDVLDGHVLDVEANVVAGDSLGQGLVVHLNGLDLSGKVDGGEGDNHAGLDHSSLHTTDRHCA